MRTYKEPQPTPEGLLVQYNFDDLLQVEVSDIGQGVWGEFQEPGASPELQDLEFTEGRFAVMSFKQLFMVLGPALRYCPPEPYRNMILTTQDGGELKVDFNHVLQLRLNEVGREVSRRTYSSGMMYQNKVDPTNTYDATPRSGLYQQEPFHNIGFVYGPYLRQDPDNLPFDEPFYYGYQHE